MNVRLVFFLGFALTLLGRAAAAVPADICATTGTSVYYGNGVNTSYDRAQEIADDDLPGLAAQAKVDDLVQVGVAYNHSDGLLADVIETLQQKSAEDGRFNWFLLNNVTSYMLRGLDVAGVLKLPPGAAALVGKLQGLIKQGIVDSGRQSEAFYNADVADQVSGYDQDFRVNGYRIVVIAHSQGNLYANAARAALTVNDAALLESFGIVAVADPAEHAFNGYVTSDNDLVINTLRKLGGTVLASNVHVPVTSGDFLGHGFEDIYINAQLPARSSVVSLFSRVSHSLRYPPPVASSCAVPSECAFNAGASTALLGGYLTNGETEVYSLIANAGQGVMIRVAEVGDGSFSPTFNVYAPSGAKVISTAAGTRVGAAVFDAQETGRYSVVVYDGSGFKTSASAYYVYFMAAPGADACGALNPNDAVSNTLGKGALDSYTFNAQGGEGVMVRVADINNTAFSPGFNVYDPDGILLVKDAGGDKVASSIFSAKKKGAYTVVVYDTTPQSGANAAYALSFAIAPGSSKGEVSLGSVLAGNLPLGGLDSYTFAAQAGQGIILQATDVNNTAFAPAFNVYDPAGILVVKGAAGDKVASYTLTPQQTGTYTIVVYDVSAEFAGSGPYSLSLVAK